MSELPLRPVRLRILGKEVQIACQPGEEDDLLRAAAHVEVAMQELQQRSTMSGFEKVAIVTAINLASTLLKHKAEHADRDSVTPRLGALNEQLEHLLQDLEPADAEHSPSADSR